MKAAIIDELTNEITNVIELEPSAKWEPPKGFRVKFCEEARIGDLHDGEKLIPIE